MKAVTCVSEIPDIPFKEATYMVVGYGDFCGGILAMARDEFTAYRWRKLYLHAFPDAKVVPVCDDELDKVDQAVDW